MSIDTPQTFGRVDPALLGRMSDLVDAAVRRMRAHLINRIGVGIFTRSTASVTIWRALFTRSTILAVSAMSRRSSTHPPYSAALSLFPL